MTAKKEKVGVSQNGAAEGAAALFPPNVLTPTSGDLQQLLASNPLAKAQLEAIIWQRKYLELEQSAQAAKAEIPSESRNGAPDASPG